MNFLNFFSFCTASTIFSTDDVFLLFLIDILGRFYGFMNSIRYFYDTLVTLIFISDFDFLFLFFTALSISKVPKVGASYKNLLMGE